MWRRMNKLQIFTFLKKEYDGPTGTIIFMIFFKAFFMALLVFVINQTTQTILAGDTGTIRMFFIYTLVCAITLYSFYYVSVQVTIMSVKIVKKMRLRLTNKLRRAELRFVENTGRGDLYARIAQDTDLVLHATPEALSFVESGILFIFMLIYVGTMSLVAFIFLALFLFAIYSIYYLNYFEIQKKLNTARKMESSFFNLLDDTLSGFKEIKINTQKNNELFADIIKLSKETEQLKKEAGFKNNWNIAFAYSFFVGLLGVVVFALPLFANTSPEIVLSLVALVMFLFGPINIVSRGFPFVMRLNAAAENMDKLDKNLDASGLAPVPCPLNIPEKFHTIELRSISYTYTGNKGEVLFSLEPTNLKIRQGEIIFITGGNGSGKSTLMKLLTGLYYPMADGKILLDGKVVTMENFQSYRELFSAIFTDFHMFKKLYGVESVDEARVKGLLKKMDIDKKTDYVDNAFTRRDLSTGQKKRLAYIAALLEDKPIYIFDEWAADQDPMFRRLFYREFLQDLKAMNKTVIAVSHDDRYFGAAERVVKMEEGYIINNQKL